MSNEHATVVAMTVAVAFALIGFAIVYELSLALFGTLGMAWVLVLGVFVGGFAVVTGAILYDVARGVGHDKTTK